MQPISQDLPLMYVLTTVVALLQLILVALMSWLIKTTATNKDQLGTVNTTLFGPNDKGGGIVDKVEEIVSKVDRVEKDINDIKHYLHVPARRADDFIRP